MASPLRQIFDGAVARMDPERRVREAIAGLGPELGGPEVYAIAIGKAACAMARGAAGIAAQGLVVAPAPCAAPWPVMIGAHPVPDERSLAAGLALVDFARSVPASARLLALVSGGASALAVVPREGVTLAEKVARVQAVIASGAPIEQINRVRVSLSAIKGGGLARMCAAPVVTLVASDVVGDDPSIVGSGPTIAGGSRALVIAGVRDLARAAADEATARGVPALVVDGGVTGDVEHVAARIAAMIDEPGPSLFVLSGEPTVRLPDSPGVGGRAQQLALLVARRLAGQGGWSFLAAGSDGVDGTGPAAGAIVDGGTWTRVADGDAAIERCDAGGVLGAIGATVVTGPTGVNHADLMLVWRGRA